VILVLVQSDLPPKQEVEAPYKDFPIVGTQTSGWRTSRILKEVRVLPCPVLPDLLQRGATLEPLFDILKQTDALNFEWVEVVRGLQPPRPGSENYKRVRPANMSSLASARNRLLASAVADGSENPRKTPDVS
jgi:hypothetical protein